MKPASLVIRSIGELATPVSENGPVRGPAMGKTLRIKNAAIAFFDKYIAAVGPEEEVLKAVEINSQTKVIDAGGRVVTPGLVDPHTHLIFGGNRANEFIMRCQGKSYAEIAQAGGGIVASTSATRAATVEELIKNGRIRLQRMLAHGTTTCEIKTGYGLTQESELKMLEAILRLAQEQSVEVVPTFMPAHAFPPGMERADYVESIVKEMLPRAVSLAKEIANGQAGTIYNDVFCDEGYFTLEQTRKILEAGQSLGLRPKVHSDEFANLGATPLAVELKASSADHLLNVSDADIEKLATSETVAVLLPGTSFFLNLKEHAPARKLIAGGAAVALGTDYNPGSCHIFSLPMIWGLACLHLKMTVDEALTALTINSAHAVGLGDRIGQLQPGKQADCVIFDVTTLEEIPYNLGWNSVKTVFKKGALAYERIGE